MAFTIGLRFYRIHVQKDKEKLPVIINEGDAGDPYKFLEKFVQERRVPTEEIERTWFFTPKSADIRTIHGLVNYGTHGFESRLVDVKTKAHNYQRKSTDLEEIPLYFQFWLPANKKFGFAAFQSFQGRSCIRYIIQAASEAYSSLNKGYRLVFQKLVANDIGSAKINASPVKELRLLRKEVPKDKADRYLNGITVDEVEYEVIMRAKRNRVLGILSDFRNLAPAGSKIGIFTMDGIEFDEVKASVEFAGRRRMIGIFGDGSDAGVIEVSDKVKRGRDGHPEFKSIANEVDELMETFYSAVIGP